MSTELRDDPDQQRAVELMCSAPVSVVTGGPGVGKTQTTKLALEQLGSRGDYVELCAPTGKAARRLTELTGRGAQTIHRLLEWSPEGFRRYVDNPLAADTVICDETSMVDILLAQDLHEAVDSRRTRLVFVGDANQLPPVGPGAFFRDLIDSGTVPVQWLRTLFRASQESWICRNAPLVLAGARLELEDSHDFAWYHMDREDAPQIVNVCLQVVKEQLGSTLVEELADGTQRERTVELADIQVLAPMKKRVGGVEPLNEMLQSHLNSNKGYAYKIYNQLIRRGDRVMQTRNNYDLGVFNGEVGIVERVNEEHLVVDYGYQKTTYDHKQATDLQLAYAMTIHKSQGSEWPVVIVVCHSAHGFMLTRQLLYTAITRAKARVFIVGDEAGLNMALRTVKDVRRRTLLQPRLQGAM